MSLYDYGLGTLAQYELTADRSARTRGALLCYTAQGLLILREFHGSEKKLEKQQELLMKLQENGINTDYFLRNNQESLVSKDKTEQRFTLQHWYEGKECDTKSREDILKSVRTLARLHILMKMEPVEEFRERSLREEYLRHNQELRKIRKFIRNKGASNVFEKNYLASVEQFLERAQYRHKVQRYGNSDTLCQFTHEKAATLQYTYKVYLLTRIILADLLTDLLDSLIYFLFCQQYSDMLCHFLLSFRF